MVNLPPPRDATLARSPLELVVCQVRHERKLAVTEPRLALAVQKALGSEFEQLQELQQTELTVEGGPSGVAAHSLEGTRGWRIASADGQWSVVLTPEYFAIESSRYTRWQEFQSRLVLLVESVFSELQPTLELRVGLRFVDIIRVNEAREPADFSGLIHKNLLGVILHPILGKAVRAHQSAVELHFDEGSVLLRHGVTVDDGGKIAYVLDHDCYRLGTREFSPTATLECVEDLHTLCKQVFEASITDDLYEQFGPTA